MQLKKSIGLEEIERFLQKSHHLLIICLAELVVISAFLRGLTLDFLGCVKEQLELRLFMENI